MKVVFMSCYLHKFLKLHISQGKQLPQFLILTIIIYSQRFFSALDSVVPLSLPQGFESGIQGAQWQVPLLFEEWKIIRNDHLLSLAVICCQSLSLVVPLIVTRCHSRYHLHVFSQNDLIKDIQIRIIISKKLYFKFSCCQVQYCIYFF